MKDLPILFSTEMVVALLAGTKRQTRRLMASPIAKAVPGQRLWVREACTTDESVIEKVVAYDADGNIERPLHSVETLRVRDALHMPRWASRITLIVTSACQELLQQISEESAREEGVADRQAFERLWDSLYGSGSWDSNPLIVALSFEVKRCNIDHMARHG